MPRKKSEVPQNKNVDIPVIENGGKVLSTDGEAIDIPEAVKFDDTPVIPKTPPKKEETKKEDVHNSKTEVLKKSEKLQTETAYSESELKNRLIEIGCVLSERLLGKNKDLNSNPITDKHIASIECLLNIYNSIEQ